MAKEKIYAWFGSVIRDRRKSMGLTLQELAISCGCTKAYLSTIETGRSAPPSSSILTAMEEKLGYANGELVRFAQATQVTESVAWMVNKALSQIRDKQGTSDCAEVEIPVDLDDVLREITPRNRSAEGLQVVPQTVMPVQANSAPDNPIRPVLPLSKDVPNIKTLRERLVSIPLLNEVTAGRYPNLRTDLDYPAGIADRYVELPGINDPNAFACTVLGESMMPRYMPGDIVIFAPNEQVLSGDDCFVRLASTETTFKRVIDLGEGQLRLLPLNPAYQSWDINREEVTGLWRAVRRIECLTRQPRQGRLTV